MNSKFTDCIGFRPLLILFQFTDHFPKNGGLLQPPPPHPSRTPLVSSLGAKALCHELVGNLWEGPFYEASNLIVSLRQLVELLVRVRVSTLYQHRPHIKVSLL